jgi:hypothetical protein
MSDGKLISPEQFALEQIKARATKLAAESGGGHLSASLRREFALQQAIAMMKTGVANLQAVLIVALEQRGGVPLLVLASRRAEILKGKTGYSAEQDPAGNVTYSLIPPEEPAAEEAPPAQEPT